MKNNIIKKLGSDKALNLCVKYIKLWYISWVAIGVITLTFSIIYFKQYGDLELGRMIYLHFVLFLKSLLYFIIAKELILVLKNEQGYNGKLRKIGMIFFILFIIDIAAMLTGKVASSNKSSLESFLGLLSKDSFSYTIYSKIYFYIPSLFDFLQPQIQGVSLLIMAVVFFMLSFRAKEIN